MLLAQRFRALDALVVRVRASFSSDLADALRSPVDEPTNYAALAGGWDEFRTCNCIGAECAASCSVASLLIWESSQPRACSAAEHGYELVIAEDLCSSPSAEMHAFSFKHILPPLARITA